MPTSLCRLSCRSPLYASRQLTKLRWCPTTPMSKLNMAFVAEKTTLPTRRHASSKVPVYFSKDANTTQQHQIPSGRPNAPVYFANPTSQAPLPISQPETQSPKRSRWALAIAFGSLGCSLYGFYKFTRTVIGNREEVPFVDRVRFNLLPDEVFLAETSPAVIATRTGYPTLETLLDSDIVVKPGEGQEIADLTHQIFDKLLADNGLSGIQLHIIYEPNLRHAENQFSRDHVIIYSGMLESCNTEPLIAAHLAPIIASTVLHHREESMSWNMMITEHLVPNALLLLPITIVFKLSAIVTIPVMATVTGLWYSRHTIEDYLDDEADGLALDFLHNAGYDVMDYLQYRVLEAQIQDQLLAQYVVDGQVSIEKAPAHQIARDVQRAQKFMRRQENVLEHLEERYQERLIRAEQEGQLVQQKPGSKPPKK